MSFLEKCRNYRLSNLIKGCCCCTQHLLPIANTGWTSKTCRHCFFVASDAAVSNSPSLYRAATALSPLWNKKALYAVLAEDVRCTSSESTWTRQHYPIEFDRDELDSSSVHLLLYSVLFYLDSCPPFLLSPLNPFSSPCLFGVECPFFLMSPQREQTQSATLLRCCPFALLN